MVSKISQANKRGQVIRTLESAYPISTEKANLAIIGAGAWGSALAKLASHNQHEIYYLRSKVESRLIFIFSMF